MEQLGLKPKTHMPTHLTYADPEQCSKMMWKGVTTTDSRGHQHDDNRRKIQSFLQNLRWQRPTDANAGIGDARHEEPGITWMELLILFHIHGGYKPSQDHTRISNILGTTEALNRAQAKELAELRKNLSRVAKALRPC